MNGAPFLCQAVIGNAFMPITSSHCILYAQKETYTFLTSEHCVLYLSFLFFFLCMSPLLIRSHHWKTFTKLKSLDKYMKD